MARKTDTKNPKIAVKILQYCMILACVIFAIAIGFQVLGYMFKNSPIFKVKEVVAHQSLQFIRSRTLDQLIGKSIFEVDLITIQKRLQYEYPQIDHLRLYRQFPNRIYIDAIRRDPFAVIIIRGKEVLVDKDATVLALSVPSNVRLPVVTGMNTEEIPVVGKMLKHSDFPVAFAIIKGIQDDPHLQSMPVVRLEMNNLSRINGTLANQLKIIIDQERIAHKIKMLGIVISQPDVNLADINYIDLRFKEPVLGKKEVGTKL